MSAIDLNAHGSRLTATSALNGLDRLEWLVKFGAEIERLLSSGTGVFIRRADVLAGKIVAYYNPQLKYKMKNGQLVMRVRGTIGGDQLPYSGPTAAQTAALEVMRLLLNALVSEGVNLMTLDIKDFYLGTPLDEPEFMRIPLKFIPLEMQLKYNLKAIQSHDSVVMRIDKSIYGLKQAGAKSQTLKPDLTAQTPLTAAQILFAQEVVGVFLYYSRAVDPLMIRSFMNHFIASMSGVDQDSPKDLWSDYDDQIEET
jgi:hypothetical protein